MASLDGVLKTFEFSALKTFEFSATESLTQFDVEGQIWPDRRRVGRIAGA